MKWTKDQVVALQDLSTWVDKPIVQELDHVFSLFGPAGTGKTTVVKEIIDVLSKKGKSFFVSAPTHKAKEVISAVTGKPGITVHSLLGLRPNLELENFNPNNPQYDSLAEILIGKADITIVDECSMINAHLFKMLVKKAREFGKRLIFIGDEYQLPPVNERKSLCFMVEHKAELKEIVRQKGSNPNHEILSHARNDVAEMSNNLRMFLYNPSNTIIKDEDGFEEGYIVTKDKEEFYNKLIEIYSDSEAKVNLNYIKTLAYTNAAVQTVNKFIKAKINPSDTIVSAGDCLLGYKTVVHPISETLIVQNSADYRVDSVTIQEKRIDYQMYKFLRCHSKQADLGYIDILHPDSYEIFEEAIERIYLNAKTNRRWRPFYAFREQFILIYDVVRTIEEMGYNGLIKSKVTITKKDIDLGYAMTIHKSQGSTYNNVAVFYHNIIKACRDVTEQRKLAYVAVSRCKYLNLIYG